MKQKRKDPDEKETHQRGGYHLPLPAGCGGEGGGEFCGEGFREDHRRFHGTPHRAWLGIRDSELSDMHKDAVVHAKFTANPGCHASGFVIPVYPLVASGMIPKETPLTVFSLTGYSGGGKKMIAGTSPRKKPELYNTPRIYGLNLKHKHLGDAEDLWT